MRDERAGGAERHPLVIDGPIAQVVRELRFERDLLAAERSELLGRVGGMTQSLNAARRQADEWAAQADAMVARVRQLEDELVVLRRRDARSAQSQPHRARRVA